MIERIKLRIEHRTPCVEHRLDETLPDILDRLFRNRGIDNINQVDLSTKELVHYKLLLNTDAAALKIANAMFAGQQITIIGDFDADGATSTALCKLAFNMFAYSNVDYLVPNRFDFGYGLSTEIVDVAHQQGAQLIITVDSGIACLPGVAHAKSLGMDVIITDHHLPGEQLPIADVIVNPNQAACQFPSKNLAGVGVAFYVMLALRAKLSTTTWFNEHDISVPNLADLLDIVAIGTVADVVPLDKNNRILVHQGLQRIRSGKTHLGIKAILDIAGREADKISASDLGFVIGPRLNAAGRLDDMSTGIETLMAETATRARQLAAQLDSLNQSRKEIEQTMQEQASKALSQIQLNDKQLPSGLVIFDEDFHQGVIGIVAGRIKEKYHRPTIVFAQDDNGLVKGSARSISGVHIRDVLDNVNTQHPTIIAKFGGHAMAAGLTVHHHKLAVFTKAFQEQAELAMQRLPKEASLLSDGQLDVNQLTLENANMLKLHVPWGQHFEEPCFDGEFELITQKIVGQKHLKMVLSYFGVEFDAIAFNVDTAIWPNVNCKWVRALYKLDINSFRGNVSTQLLVNHLIAI